MAGIQEILTLILIIMCIIFLPRLFRGGEAPSVKRKKSGIRGKLSWQKRLGIVFSVMWPVVAGILMRPWDGQLILFISTGILPVVVGWAVVWVAAGTKIKKNLNKELVKETK